MIFVGQDRVEMGQEPFSTRLWTPLIVPGWGFLGLSTGTLR